MRIHPIRLSAALLVLVPLVACGGREDEETSKPPEVDAPEAPDTPDADAPEASDVEDAAGEVGEGTEGDR